MRAEAKPHFTAIARDAERALYRLVIPIRTLIEQGAATGNVLIGPTQPPKVLPGSLLLLQSPTELSPVVVSAAKSNHCRIAVDVDDPSWLTSEKATTIDRQLRDADLVTASTDPLAQALRKRGFDSAVLLTTVDPHDWAVQPQRANRTKLRIGWHARRSTHADELVLLAAIVQALINEADFVFFGDVPAALMDATGRIERHSPVPLAFFPALFAALDLDIVLVPLAQTAVNECRSNLALLQAGMLGYPVLATDIEPHRTLPATCVPNKPNAWIAAVRDRIHAGEALLSEGAALRRAVHAGYLTRFAAQRHLALWTGTSLAAAHA